MTQTNVDPVHARIGQVVGGKWRLEKLCGAGGFAAVYEAVHEEVLRSVAIKILHTKWAKDSDIMSRFRSESRATNIIDDRRIVRVYDFGITDEGAPFIVMELLVGMSAEARLLERGAGLDCEEVVRIGKDVLEVLAVAHAHGIVHRDIKPENIFVQHDGSIKVLDFGIARFRNPLLPVGSETKSGVVLGSPQFMAPEQMCAERELIGPSTDIWSVGASMFRLLSGKHLFENASNISELTQQMLNGSLPRLRDVAPHVDREIAAVIDRALTRDAKKRWPDANTMLAALTTASGKPLHSMELVSTERANAALPAVQPASLEADPRSPSTAEAPQVAVPDTRRWTTAQLDGATGRLLTDARAGASKSASLDVKVELALETPLEHYAALRLAQGGIGEVVANRYYVTRTGLAKTNPRSRTGGPRYHVEPSVADPVQRSAHHPPKAAVAVREEPTGSPIRELVISSMLAGGHNVPVGTIIRSIQEAQVQDLSGRPFFPHMDLFESPRRSSLGVLWTIDRRDFSPRQSRFCFGFDGSFAWRERLYEMTREPMPWGRGVGAFMTLDHIIGALLLARRLMPAPRWPNEAPQRQWVTLTLTDVKDLCLILDTEDPRKIRDVVGNRFVCTENELRIGGNFDPDLRDDEIAEFAVELLEQLTFYFGLDFRREVFLAEAHRIMSKLSRPGLWFGTSEATPGAQGGSPATGSTARAGGLLGVL